MKRFNWRAFTSWYIVFSFLVMIISGLILYTAPPGRLAKWTYIPLLGLEKDQWQTIHTIFTFLFIIASGFHIYFNWSFILAYIKHKTTKNFTIKKELLTSFILAVIIFFLAAANFGPFQSVMDYGQLWTDSWDTGQIQPPIPHAEDLTLHEIADLIDQPADSLKNILQSNKIKVENSKKRLKDLAKENDHSPQEIYQLLEKPQKETHSQGRNQTGRGWGRKTIRQLCQEMNIDETAALMNLKTKGIEAAAESKIKEIALEHNLRSSEVVSILANRSRNNFKSRR